MIVSALFLFIRAFKEQSPRFVDQGLDFLVMSMFEIMFWFFMGTLINIFILRQPVL